MHPKLENDLPRSSTTHLGSRPDTLARRPRIPRIAALAVLLPAMVAVAAPGAHAATLGPPLDSEVLAVSTVPGYQVYGSVSGSWVVYTSVDEGTSEVRYYDLATGADQAIPTLGGQDFLAAVDGTSVVYVHLEPKGVAIYGYDLATGGPPVELDPQPNPQRSLAAIGGDTVVWADFGDPSFLPAIAVYDRGTGIASLLTTHESFNSDPRLSPDGATLVWTRCLNYPHVPPECDVWQATLTEGGWSSSPLAAEPGIEETTPDTDGNVVVYIRGQGYEQGQVAWQPAGGGAEETLGLPGTARFPRVSGGILAFEYLPPEGTRWDVWIYDIRRDVLRQATFGPEDARLPDVFVAADGRGRLAWSSGNDWQEMDLYTRSFQVPSSMPVEEVAALAELVESLGLLDGIATSLTAKLAAAIAALEAADTATACFKLADFQAQVRAQSGKALTWEQAADLTAAAENIRSLLGCW